MSLNEADMHVQYHDARSTKPLLVLHYLRHFQQQSSLINTRTTAFLLEATRICRH